MPDTLSALAEITRLSSVVGTDPVTGGIELGYHMRWGQMRCWAAVSTWAWPTSAGSPPNRPWPRLGRCHTVAESVQMFTDGLFRRMYHNNGDALRTAFTVTVDATEGIGTGISASDRAHDPAARRPGDRRVRPRPAGARVPAARQGGRVGRTARAHRGRDRADPAGRAGYSACLASRSVSASTGARSAAITGWASVWARP